MKRRMLLFFNRGGTAIRAARAVSSRTLSILKQALFLT